MKMKGLLSLILIFSLLMATSIFASQNTGVSYDEPIVSLARSTDIPNNYWNLATQGAYNFGGSANYQNLYTDYFFSGRLNYTVSVTNNLSSTLTVLVKDRFNTYGTITVPGNKTVTTSVIGMSTDAGIYLLFQPASDFYGYIQ